MPSKPMMERLVLAAFMVAMCTVGFLGADNLPALFAGSQDGSDLEPGLKFLRSQSIADTEPIKTLLKQQRLDALHEQVLEDEEALFAAFNGSMILGDSRASGFYYYGFLPKSICLAEMNETMRSLEQYVSQVAAAKPEYLFISYGINDVKARLGGSSEDGYARLTEEAVEDMLAVSPDTTIVLCSILECAPGVLSEEEEAILASYNQQLQALCQEKGWIYADNSSLMADNPDGWGPDGIHFNIPFYPKWAANLVAYAMLEKENL